MFDFLFNPSGRISRKGYWIGFLLPYLALTELAPRLLGGVPGMGVVFGLIALFYLWPSVIAVPFKRMHDLGKSGWLYLGAMIVALVLIVAAVVMGAGQADGGFEGFAAQMESMPEDEVGMFMFELVMKSPAAMVMGAMASIIYFGFVIYLLFFPGQSGPNQYGNDPLVGGRGFAD
ncbi:DUF805 domain-containing protein [Parvularcula lutaonensis]|uniref:DUF805 domain-containing protein n=1 Tax=Parvularcula lutaonensis TaxID=491923 RepID=A0ABV7M7C1_9PROT|nr:DUF805 domain-containing protein [Parvularcula lutaonensis]GGY41836.1 hypothetical protein GCM10007148_08070 [Parvularcula lutaonensis]